MFRVMVGILFSKVRCFQPDAGEHHGSHPGRHGTLRGGGQRRDRHTGKYTDFEKVSVRKFLRADATCDKKVNSADAVAVINYSK